MSRNDLHLPQPLSHLDEQALPQASRDKIASMVALGYFREHMMISSKFDVHISEELAMCHEVPAPDVSQSGQQTE